MNSQPDGVIAEDSFDTNSKEYSLSTCLSGVLGDLNSRALGDLLTMVEFALGDTKQAESMKKLVKQCMYGLKSDVQHQVYYAFGIEKKQYGDNGYIEAVLSGKEDEYRKIHPLTEATSEVPTE